jgi:NADPH-dependent glutamate synthase beta subunit-like oxidoreductase/ferredoxin
MLTLKIDGVPVSVEPGATVLQAAEKAGVRIPTLCHVPGLEPATSCFLCAVKVEGRRGFVPACALPAAEGMAVATASEEVLKVRRLALELLLSDHAGDCLAPCAATCPAGLDVPGFLDEVRRHDVGRAAEVIARKIALPGVLGRICPRLCESECRRKEHDEGVSIAALHRYVSDQGWIANPHWGATRTQQTGRSVAIVGAGPAGLSAAFHLLAAGHAVTIFDAWGQPGGMLRYAIPAYRLPRASLAAEITVIEALGARFEMGQRWGTNFTLADLRRDFDAVFLAIGAQRPQRLQCECDELAMPALEFLHRLADENPPMLGDDVMVIGGGNTAVDCARSAVRMHAPRVRILYRRTRNEMPCLLAEAVAAEEEGVTIEYLVAPVRLRRTGPREVTLTCQRMALGEPDSSGRRRPVPVAGSEFDVRANTVVAALGQSVDLSVAEREGLRLTRWGVEADPRTMATSIEGVFAGGDMVLGADLAVRAVASGRIAAASICQYLHGETARGEPAAMTILMKPMDDLERAAMFRAIEKSARAHVPEIDITLRQAAFDEVEPALSDEAAEREARRCLECGCAKADTCRLRALATEYGADPYRFPGARRRYECDESHPEIVYEPGKCISCQACVRIAAQEMEPFGVTLTGRGFDVRIATPFGLEIAEGLRKSARHCAESCPTGALALRSAHRCDLEDLTLAGVSQS